MHATFAKRWYSLFAFAALLGLSLAACQSSLLAQPTATLPPSPTVPVPTPTATIPPPRTLVICLGQEPQSLYLYADSSRGMWSVLEAVYDGPIDRRQFGYQPVILQKLPALADGDAVIESVAVKAGDVVVDASGSLTTLAKDTRVTPSGCSGPDCAVAWDGTSELKMDRVKLTYKLLADIKWSDGTPLTAADSVYSFELASDPSALVSKSRVDLTASYRAVDDQTVEWLGQPGYRQVRAASYFWTPLPRHVLGKANPADIAKMDEARLRPLGWGPYQIEEWVAGDHIRLQKNPNYFRAQEGLPKFDTLVYRFLGKNGDNNLAALQSGECDMVDQTSLLEDQLEKVLDLKKANKLNALIGQGPEVETLDFGIQPAAYDAGYNAFTAQRADFFSDVNVRKAFALCMNRQEVVEKQLLSQSEVPASYLPPTHPLFLKDLKPLAYDPAQGSALLDAAGWKDLDNDPGTPRVAAGVKTVKDGTPLSISYITTETPLRREVTRRLTDSMKACGIEVKVQFVPQADLYGKGPDGLLFGRKFDLAEFVWQAGEEPPCFLYQSAQVPGEGNRWLGANVTGYKNPAYDAICQAARTASPDSPDYAANHQQAMRLLAEELPTLPLYHSLKIAITRPDLCGLEMDVSSRSEFWNLEELDFGTGCK